MDNKKLTAVQWLIKQIVDKHNGNDDLSYDEMFDQAKQMEKVQIMEAYSKGEFNDGCNENEEEYYNQTYTNQNENRNTKRTN